MVESQKLGIILVGCGTVGGGTAKVLKEKIQKITRKTGLNLELKYIVDVNFDHARSLGLDDALFQSDLDKALSDPEISLVIELVGGTGFAKTVFEKALGKGKHVISANKALLAEYGEELFQLARKNKVGIGLEASCGGGIPIIQTLVEDMIANDVDGIYGILNGTCNYILTEMLEKGRPFETALKEAQALGLAEADPTLDISGMDTAHKMTILASLAFQKTFKLSNIPVRGIENIDLIDVQLGQDLGFILKLIAFGEIQNGESVLWVGPAFLPKDHLLGSVKGSFNAVSVYGHAVGHTLYYGRGAGASPTASAVVSDLVNAATGHLQYLQSNYKIWPGQTPEPNLCPEEKQTGQYYIRFTGEKGALIPGDLQENLLVLPLHGFQWYESGHMVLTTHRITGEQLRELLASLKGNPWVKDMSYYPIIGARSEFKNPTA